MSPLAVAALAFFFVAVGAELSEEECRKPPPNWPEEPPLCCKGELPFPTTGMKKAFETCVQALPPPPENPRALENDPRLCLDECVYKNTGFMVDGKGLSGDVIKKAADGIPAPWSSVMKNAVETCASVKKPVAEGLPCNPLPQAHTLCITRQLFLNCPKDKWVNSKECNIVKKRMEECPGLPPPPPPPSEVPPQSG